MLEKRFTEDPRFGERRRKFPTVRRIQGWIKDWRENPRQGLRDDTAKSGNRLPRHDSLFERIVLDELEKSYLTSDRPTLKRIADLAKALYLKECEKLGREPADCGLKVVASIERSLPHADVVKLRLGSKAARARLLQAGMFHSIDAPLERVEVDCTPADVFIIDDDGNVVGRFFICAAIDAATGVILALQVQLEPPNSELVARSLKEMMTPKSDEFFSRHGITNRFQAYGPPLLVVADQGPENGGDAMESILNAGGFEFLQLQPGNPQGKPFIERLFREINRFLSELPGATWSSIVGPQERNERAMEEARLTLHEVDSRLQHWRYDIYSRTPRRRIQSVLRTSESPAACWKRLSEKHLVPEPMDHLEIRDLFFIRGSRRTLHHYGIEFERIQYSSPELRAFAKNRGFGAKVEIRFDPSDIREIAVYDDFTGSMIFVPAKDPETPGISFRELKLLRKKFMPDPSEEITAKMILAAVVASANQISPPGKTKLAASRQKAAALKRAREVIQKARPNRSSIDPVIEAPQIPAPIMRPKSIPSVTPRRSAP
jgi:putative transposase